MKENSTEKFSEYLNSELSYLKENNLKKSEQKIIQSLLDRKLEMSEVYKELACNEPHQWKLVLDAIISTAAFWSPKRMKKQRDAVNEANRLLSEISDKALELASMLDLYRQLREQYNLTTPEGFACPFDLIDLAAKDHPIPELESNYRIRIKPEIDAIRQRYDGKYYPHVTDLIELISSLAAAHVSDSAGAMEQAATHSQKSSPADFYRALIARLELEQPERGGLLPYGFSISQNAMAIISTCALELEAGSVTANNIKQWKRSS